MPSIYGEKKTRKSKMRNYYEICRECSWRLFNFRLLLTPLHKSPMTQTIAWVWFPWASQKPLQWFRQTYFCGFLLVTRKQGIYQYLWLRIWLTGAEDRAAQACKLELFEGQFFAVSSFLFFCMNHTWHMATRVFAHGYLLRKYTIQMCL